MWLAQEVIRRKRDGLELAGEDIRRFVEGISDSSLSEGQVAAFAMAVLLKGMSLDERIALTTAMRDSGQVLEWQLPGPVVDKHSTGGVGDLVSLVLAPLLAACGCYVPMISGRGLGHTGGTLDKLESIPGYCTRPDPERLRAVVAEVGCAIIGQTADLAPADKRLYGIRDVTGTVESVDLITASILAKKLAAGLDVLIMDVKSGNGAFMSDPQQADLLARSLVAVANGAGVRTRAVISDMNQPLARSAGNALEVEEALALLGRGAQPAPVGGDPGAGRGNPGGGRAGRGLRPGPRAPAAGLARRCCVAALQPDGGCPWRSPWAASRALAPPALGAGGAPGARRTRRHRPGGGYPRRRARGGRPGGGRKRPEDEVDPAVGFSALALPGERVGDEQPLGLVHARDAASAERAAAALRAAYQLGDGEASVAELIGRRY